MNMPPLARFLIDRACGSLALGNALFWFLTAEMQTDRVLGYVRYAFHLDETCSIHQPRTQTPTRLIQQYSRTFESVRFAFLYTLNERDALAYAALSAQEGWLKRIFKARKMIYI